MGDSYDREVVRQETTGEPVSPVTPVTTTRTHVSTYSTSSSPVIAAVWWVVGLVDTLIAIRFLLKLFGASTVSSFVRFMYDLTAALVFPFHGIFNTTVEGRSVFEPESIVAIIVYALVGWGIVSFIRVLTRGRHSTTVVD